MLKASKKITVEFEDKVTTPTITYNKRSCTLTYPKTCTISSCSPYKITLEKGIYQFECWGAKGIIFYSGTPGLGSYASGCINISEKISFYVFIGATGFFNSLKINQSLIGPQGSGGATDVRLKATKHWYDFESLATRLIVAAGGGSTEWQLSIGGNGGGIEGGSSVSQIGNFDEGFKTSDPCPGANQTSSRECPPLIFDSSYRPTASGGFGYVEAPDYFDEGGFGGNGYYGGTSYAYAGGGSGGSSFISGHDGCKAIKDPSQTGNEIVHKEDSIHYSGIYFTNTKMIPGNETMPLPNGGKGLWNEKNGAFRITCIENIPTRGYKPRHALDAFRHIFF